MLNLIDGYRKYPTTENARLLRDYFERNRQLNGLGMGRWVRAGYADCSLLPVSPPSLSSGGDQLCGLALLSISPEPSHGRGDARGARNLRDLRNRASVGEEVRQGVRRSDPSARARSRRQMAYGWCVTNTLPRVECGAV